MVPTKKPKSAASKMGINRRKKEAKARKTEAKRAREAVEIDVIVAGGVVVDGNIGEQQESVHNKKEVHPNEEGEFANNVKEKAWDDIFETEEGNCMEEEHWDDICFAKEVGCLWNRV